MWQSLTVAATLNPSRQCSNNLFFGWLKGREEGGQNTRTPRKPPCRINVRGADALEDYMITRCQTHPDQFIFPKRTVAPFQKAPAAHSGELSSCELVSWYVDQGTEAE